MTRTPKVFSTFGVHFIKMTYWSALFNSPDAAGGRDLTDLLEGDTEPESQPSSDLVIGSQISEVETHALELRT